MKLLNKVEASEDTLKAWLRKVSSVAVFKGNGSDGEVLTVDYTQPLVIAERFSVVKDFVHSGVLEIPVSKIDGYGFYPGKVNPTEVILNEPKLKDYCYLPENARFMDLRLAQEMMKPENHFIAPAIFTTMPTYILGTILEFEQKYYIGKVTCNLSSAPTLDSKPNKTNQQFLNWIHGYPDDHDWDKHYQEWVEEYEKEYLEWFDSLGYHFELVAIEDCYFWRDYLDEEQQLYAFVKE